MRVLGLILIICTFCAAEEDVPEDIKAVKFAADVAKRDKTGWEKCFAIMKSCPTGKRTLCFPKYRECVRKLSPFTQPTGATTDTPIYTRHPRIKCLMKCVRLPIPQRRKCRQQCSPLRP